MASRVLTIATSGPSASVALSEGSTVVARSDILTRSATSELVMQMIDEAMRRTSTKPVDLRCIGVTRGPGSFTGIRVGLSTARALGLGWELPVVSVTTFEAVAARLGTYGGPVMVLLDARRRQIYAQSFGPPAGAAREAGGHRLLDPAHLSDLAWAPAAFPPAVAGTAVPVYAEVIRAAFPSAWIVPNALPDAAAVAEALGAGLGSPDLEPLYIRPPDARVPGGGAPA
jgi:tRNA threonylcarbamoyladenosine biosynthesis protein TsaB